MSERFIWGKIPKGWRVEKLKNVTKYISRGKQPKYVNYSDIKVLNQKVIRMGDLDNSSFRYHDTEMKIDERHFIRKNDVVINSTGVGTVGRVYHFTYEPEKMIADSHVTIVRTDERELHPRFLMYQLSNKRYQKFIESAYLLGSTGQVEFNKSQVENLLILLPPLQEQKKIASILLTIDKKIELNHQINQDLEEMAEAIFRSWFIDFEPFQDGEFVESELGKIPKGWRVERLGDVAHISSGKRPKDKKTESIGKYSVPVIGASKVMGYVNKPLYEEPILVIGRVGTHGVVQRVYGKSWPSDNTLVIKTIYHGFVYHILKQIDYKALNRGSTQPLITQRDLSNKKIVLPSEKVLCDFEDVIKKFTVHYNQNQLQNQDLIQLRDTLLPKLISGELRIPTEEGVESL